MRSTVLKGIRAAVVLGNSNLWAVGLIGLVHGCLVSAQPSNADVAAAQSATSATNLHLEQSLAQQARVSLGDTPFSNLTNPGPPAPDAARMLNAIALRAQQSQKDNDIGAAILKGNSLLIKGSVAAGVILAPVTGGTSVLAVTAVTGGLSLGLDKVQTLYQESAQESIRRNLKASLNEYRQQAAPADYQGLLNAPDAASFRAQLEEKVGSVFGSSLNDLPQDQQDIVNAFYNHELANILTAGLDRLSSVQEVQSSEIDQNRKDIRGLALTFTQFADRTQEQLTGILATQQDLTTGLQTLNARVGHTEQGVAFMQSVMFGKLSPAEQLSALRAGMGPDLSPEQRQDLEEKIAVVAKREELTAQVSSYLNGASELSNIAKNLGVDPAIVAKANEVISVGNSAVTAFADFSSGNVLGGISAISNVFGIGGSDAAAERQRQIMQMLGVMYDKLNVIDRKIDELKAGQQLILQTQQTILQSIDQLSAQVQQDHVEVMDALHELSQDVLYNRHLLAAAGSRFYASCQFWIVENNGTRIVDTANSLYPPLAAIATLRQNRLRQFDDCAGQLGAIRDSDESFRSDVFPLETYKRDNNDVGRYLATVYTPAVEILMDSTLSSDGRSPEQRAISLLAPMQTVPALDEKWTVAPSADIARFRRGALSDLLPTALAPSAVIHHDQTIVDFHYYYLVMDPDNHVRSATDLYRADAIRMTGRDQLLEALSLTDIAIAQQTLVSGDAILPLIQETLVRFNASSNSAEVDKYKKMMALIRANSVLARNFLVYELRREVLAHTNLLSYSVALGAQEPSLLAACTSKRWSFHYSDTEERDGPLLKTPKGWSVDLDGILVALPSAEDLLDAQFVYPDELRKLLGWRNRLLQEIATYDLYVGLGAGTRVALNSLVLRSLSGTVRSSVPFSPPDLN